MDLLQGHLWAGHGSDAGGSPEAAARNTSGGRLCTDAWFCIRVCILACIRACNRAGPCIGVGIGIGISNSIGTGTRLGICTGPRA